MWTIITIIFLIYLLAAALFFIFMILKEDRQDSGTLYLKLFINQIKIEGKITMVSLKTTQFVEGQLQPVDRLGNPAPVEPGSVRFTSSDENVFRAAQDAENELNVRLIATGVGVAQLSYSADADLGEGIVTIEGFTGVEVLPADAVGFGITFGEPQEQE